MKEIRFYRAVGPYGFLSNLFPRGLWYKGRCFRNSEEAYQYEKPKDRVTADWLVSAPKPHLVAVAAHALLPFDVRPDWNEVKVGIMKEVVKEKFAQNHDLWQMLQETGDAELIEESKTDPFWGIGRDGKGRNQLGKILMEVRDA